jgi:hypothetical protein
VNVLPDPFETNEKRVSTSKLLGGQLTNGAGDLAELSQPCPGALQMQARIASSGCDGFLSAFQFLSKASPDQLFA